MASTPFGRRAQRVCAGTVRRKRRYPTKVRAKPSARDERLIASHQVGWEEREIPNR
jgi:hypothetical protein